MLRARPLSLSLVLPPCIALVAPGCFNPPETPLPSEGSSTTAIGEGSTTLVDPTTGGMTTGSTTVSDLDTTNGAVDSTTTGPEETTAELVPDIQVSVDGMVIDPGGSFDLADTVAVGQVGAAVTVTVENVGTDDLQIGGVLVMGPGTDDFVVEQGGLATTIAAGDASAFTVMLTPQAGGLRQALLSLASDDPEENPYDITVRGHTIENAFRPIMAMGPSARFNAPLVDLQDGRLLLFGGRDNNGIWLGDTWIFELATHTWTQLPLAPPMAPPARNAHGMARLDADTVVLFGGTNSGAGGALGDTWLFDTVAEQWSLDPGAAPPARFQHGMVSIGDNRALLFGGMMSPGNEFGDTWVFDGATNAWQNMVPPAGPQPTASFALAFDDADTAIVIGGFQSQNPINQTWRYAVSTNSWSSGTITGGPGARAVLDGEILDDGRMVVWSGKLGNCCVNPSPGMYAYDPVANTWANLMPMGEPTPRFNYSMAEVVGENRAILFGGQLQNGGPGSAVAETWEYVGFRP
ncbi:Kelch repeat-containing protein [Paraliomyxa miuraensis]|uniref:Kelch repeat-containing protein n=1 Tax=Paraliomyxa miuraensis TaxID=376150 RepID=UPI0022515509|nr:kelch repeat-containing protein [Paraliomyxa miuraensis]MCX4242402.1 choice-of-anchor D domain-containing protein [Paraliomyxa miuraensis]